MVLLTSYTKLNVLMISLVITVVIYCIIICLYGISVNAYNYEKNLKADEINITSDNKSLWQLEIPKINLVAPIAEGIDENTISKYIGHFPSTSRLKGNIGLAAHNRRI